MSKKWFLFFMFFLLQTGFSESSVEEYSPAPPAPVPASSLEEEMEKEGGKEKSEKNSNMESKEMSVSQRFLSSSKKVKRIKIKRDERFKVPDSHKKPVKKKRRMSLKEIQPPSSSRLYYTSGDEAELEQVINEEIKQLFKLLKQKRDAELTLRLGSLYVDKARLISSKMQIDYENKMEAYRAGRRKTKPYFNLKPVHVYNRKSLKLFEDFKLSYPKHKRMDEVLFFLGFNFYQLKNEKQGIKYFTELESKYPHSFYIYEARFQLGEHYFKLGQWKNSYDYYSKVSKNKRGKFYFFALYKMAWSAYKRGQVSRGLALLERIIREGRKFKVRSDRNQVFTFTSEAVEDLVLFYTYSKKSPASAKSFFLSLLDDKIAWSSLKRLAYAYRDTDQTQAVIVLFEDLIRHNPVGEKAAQYKYQMVSAVYNFGKTSEIIRQADDWLINYGPDSSWFQANKRNQKLIKESFDFQEVTIRDYALKNHDTFRRARSRRAKTLALSFYKIYFDHFEKSTFMDQMHFWYAELLFDSKKYISAVKFYEKVLSQFPNSKYAKAAYLNQILALEKTLPTDKQIQNLVGKGEEPVELSNAMKAFMKVSHRYIKTFPEAKNSPSVLYTMAVLYYKFNQFSLAAKFFKKMSDDYPYSKLASNVGSVLLDIYNKNRDYKSLEELALKLSQNPKVNKELLREVRSVLEQISFKKAQDLALNKKFKESALLYEEFARTNPSSPLAPSAFYNAGLNFEKSGDSLTALSMYSAVLTYKGNKYGKIRKNSQGFLPVLYEKLGFYKKAAQSYVSFAKKYSADSKSSDFWFNAGVIFDALNDKASAVYSYHRYFSSSRKADRHEIFYFIGSMYEKNRNWRKVIDNYMQYLKSPSSNKLRLIKASFSIADIYERKLRNRSQAKIWHQKTLNLYNRLQAGVSYGARSHFYIVQDFYNSFSQVKIPADTKKQESAVAKKLKLLKKLEQALKPIIRYNDGEQIIASLSLIGRANQDMAQALYHAPVPKALDKQGKARYRAGIKKLIEPYVQKALKHYRLALKKSSEFQVYSEWIAKAYSGLSGFQLFKGGFDKFFPETPFQETFPLQLLDNTGTVDEGFLKTWTKSLKYGLAKEDFGKLSQAMAQRRESDVLKAISLILNKDPDNVLAINSLAFFYLQKNRWGLANLILNRLSAKKSHPSVIMNNLAMISLKYGDVRLAVTYLKKALSDDRSYHKARVNLANIFIRQWDYGNAYSYYKNSYKEVIKKWPSKDRKTLFLLNNYGVALTGAKKWSPGLFVFKNLVSNPSPLTEILFNYACFLTEKSKEESRNQSRQSLLKAKELVDELALHSAGARLRRKVSLLSKSVSRHLHAHSSDFKLRSKKIQTKRKK